MFGQRREIVGVVIEVVPIGYLSRAAMAAPVMSNDAEAMPEEEHHLVVPVVGRQRPAVAEHDRLPRAPVLVEDLYAVLGGDRRHCKNPFRKKVRRRHATNQYAGDLLKAAVDEP